MTSDMEAAIACGSTLVRIGTAIFGARLRLSKIEVYMEHRNIAFIGAGNMAQIIAGLVQGDIQQIK